MIIRVLFDFRKTKNVRKLKKVRMLRITRLCLKKTRLNHAKTLRSIHKTS